MTSYRCLVEEENLRMRGQIFWRGTRRLNREVGRGTPLSGGGGVWSKREGEGIFQAARRSSHGCIVGGFLFPSRAGRPVMGGRRAWAPGIGPTRSRAGRTEGGA